MTGRNTECEAGGMHALMLESRLNSSMLRPQKPLDRQAPVARIVSVEADERRNAVDLARFNEGYAESQKARSVALTLAGGRVLLLGVH